MPEFCTCGAKLPEDARFCHKCGKPQRDEPIVFEEPAIPPPLPEPPKPKFPPIGFHNRIAVRIALMFGLLSLLLSSIMGQIGSSAGAPPAVFLIWQIAAGFMCVLLYRRRTGQRLTMLNGAHLGWICGLFVFGIALVLLTAGVVSDPSVFDKLKDQLQQTQGSAADINQVIEVLRTPAGILFAVLGLFLLLTALPAFGGALGAKLLDRE